MVLIEYIALVVLGAVVALFTAGLPGPGVDPILVAFWVLANMLGEALWLPAPRGRGYLSMATASNFAALLVLPTSLAIFVTVLAGGLVDILFRNRRWYQVLFNASVTCAAVFTASRLFVVIGAGTGSLELLVSPLNAAAIGVAATIYFFMNSWLVSGVIALDKKLVACEVWSSTFASRRELVGSVILVLLGLLFAVLYLAWGYMSALVVSAAAYFVREVYRHYVTVEERRAAA